MKLLNCTKKKAREFYPIVYRCEKAINELGTKLGHNEEVTAAEFCRSVHSVYSGSVVVMGSLQKLTHAVYRNFQSCNK